MTSLGKSVAVVGAGPGLGAALADAFADTGYQVAMLARDAERLATLASAAKSHLTAIACDATDPEAVANAFNQKEVDLRSEERRDGKECVSTCNTRRSPYQ